jgi:hypothetical protein
MRGETTMSQTHEDPNTYSTPRWLKISAIILVVLILLFGILHLTTGNGMGPGMHMPPTEQGTQQP